MFYIMIDYLIKNVDNKNNQTRKRKKTSTPIKPDIDKSNENKRKINVLPIELERLKRDSEVNRMMEEKMGRENESGFKKMERRLKEKDKKGKDERIQDFLEKKGEWEEKTPIPQNGYGTYTFMTGITYKGNWKNGLKHGQGKEIDSSGNIINEGIWEKGKLVEKEKKNHQKEKKDKDLNTHMRLTKNDLTEKNFSEQPTTRLYHNDIPFTGIVYYKYENGNLLYERECKEGVMDGISKEWYENGQIKSESFLKIKKDDKTYINVYEEYIYNGTQKEWYENGQIKEEFIWENWTPKIQKKYHGNGELMSSNNGEICKKYYNTGKLQQEYKRQDSVSNFIWNGHYMLYKDYNSDEKLTFERNFFKLNNEYIISECWYESGKREYVSLEDIDGNKIIKIVWSEDGKENIIENKIRNRFLFKTVINELENTENNTSLTGLIYSILEQTTEDDYDDPEDCYWDDGNQETIFECHIDKNGNIGNDFEKIDLIQVKSDDNCEIEEFKSQFLDDINEYGDSLKDFVSIEELENKINSITNSKNEEEVIDDNLKKIKDQLLEYLKI